MAFPVTRYRPIRTVNESQTGYTETMGNAKTVWAQGMDVHAEEVTIILNERVDVRVGDVLAVQETLHG